LSTRGTFSFFTVPGVVDLTVVWGAWGVVPGTAEPGVAPPAVVALGVPDPGAVWFDGAVGFDGEVGFEGEVEPGTGEADGSVFPGFTGLGWGGFFWSTPGPAGLSFVFGNTLSKK